MDADYIIENYFLPNSYFGKNNKPYDDTLWCIPNQILFIIIETSKYIFLLFIIIFFIIIKNNLNK